MIRRTRIPGALPTLANLGPRRSRVPGALWPANLAGEETTAYSPLTQSIYINEGGGNESMNFGYISTLDFAETDEYTIAFWIKQDEYVAGTNLFGQAVYSGGYTTGWWVSIGQGGYGAVQINHQDGTSGVLAARSGKNVTNNQWHLVVIRCDGTNDDECWSIDVDGKPYNSIPYSGSAQGDITTSSADFMIAELDGLAGSDPSCRLCHLAIYNTRLSDSETAALWVVDDDNMPVVQDLAKLAQFANLEVWYPLGNGDAVGTDNILDISGNGYNGTYTAGDAGDWKDQYPGRSETYSPNTTAIWFNEDALDNKSVDFGNIAATDFEHSDSFTVVMCFRTTTQAGTQVLIGKRESGGSGWWASVWSTGKPLLLLSNGVSTMYAYDNAVDLNNDEWWLVIWRYDGSNAPSGIDITIKGVHSAGLTTSGSALSGSITNSASLRVGAYDYDASGEFQGMGNHSAVFSTRLTDDECQEIVVIDGDGNLVMQDLSQHSQVAYLEHWAALGDGDAVGTDNVVDLSGNGNPGTYDNGDASDFVNDHPNWTPLEWSDVVMWRTAERGVVVNAAGDVTDWLDQTANGHDATQATAADQPTWKPGFFLAPTTDRSCIEFPGAGEHLETASSADLNPGTGSFYYCCAVEFNDGGDHCVFGKSSNADGENIRCLNAGAYLYTWWGDDTEYYTPATAFASVAVPQVYGWGIDDQSDEVLYDVKGTFERKSVTISGTGSNSLDLVTGVDTSGAWTSDMQLAEEIFIKRTGGAISEKEIKQLHFYLKGKNNL